MSISMKRNNTISGLHNGAKIVYNARSAFHSPEYMILYATIIRAGKSYSCSFSMQKITIQGGTMTKNKKIKLLINDNKRLLEENKKLNELSNEEISRKMVSEMERYSDVIDKLYGKYKELDRLRIIGVRNRCKYQTMLLGLKARKMFGIW